MKKALLILFFLIFPLMCNAADEPVIKGGVTFDWISKTQIQRDANIQQIHDIMFQGDTIKKIPKKEFKEQYKAFLKDKNHLKNAAEIAKGKKENKNCKYSGFFLKNGLLIAYGIQYKNDVNHNYYYDAMGNLQYVDTFSQEYPNFPYYSSQYRVNGKLVGKFYSLSDYDQYIYDENGKFKGRWYKDKMYNRRAKVVMTRSNW